MSEQPVRAATHPDPYGWRPATVRILANALLVLPAYGVAIVVVGPVRGVATGAPAGPVESWLLLPVFLLVRWLYVLPGLLLVLIGIEYVARRAPHARVLTAIAALAPAVWWELTQSSGDTSWHTAILALAAVLFAVVARLPNLFPGDSARFVTADSE